MLGYIMCPNGNGGGAGAGQHVHDTRKHVAPAGKLNCPHVWYMVTCHPLLNASLECVIINSKIIDQ